MNCAQHTPPAARSRAKRTAWAPPSPSSFWLACLLALVVMAALACPDAFAARPAPAKQKEPTPAAAPAPADAPVARFQTLLARKQATPAALRKLEAELEAARAKAPDGAQGAKAQFFLARVQEEIARKTGARADWARSEESFGQYLERFPKHLLVPEALVKRGYLRLSSLSDPDGALADFQAVVKKHPGHPRAATARSLAAQAEKAKARGIKRAPEIKAESRTETRAEAKAATPAPPKPADLPPPPVPNQKPRGAGPASLVEMRYKTASDYSRVVLDVDAPVRFKYQLIDASGAPVPSPAEGGAKGERPRRLYIDLMGTHVGRGIAAETKVSGGMLKSLRANQKDPDTTRIVLEVTEFHDYKVFALENPFRLVVDVYGAPAPRKAAPAHDDDDDDRDDARPGHGKDPGQVVKGGIKAPKGGRGRMAADLVEQLGLTVRTIMLDAGHGGKDPGAQGNGLVEKDVNLRMALALGKVLKERGFKVVYTRTTDEFIPLEERTARANVRKVDLFLSIHCNAHHDPSMSGLETYSLNLARTPDAVRVAARENAVSDKSISDLQMILTDLMLTSKIKESLDLARGVQKNGLATLRQGKFTVTDHGNREAPFYVLMGAKMPSVLVEIGYITNKTEAGRLKGDYYLRTLARGIADGVVEYKHQLERYAVKK